jgi:hypothetical protein
MVERCDVEIPPTVEYSEYGQIHHIIDIWWCIGAPCVAESPQALSHVLVGARAHEEMRG